MPTNPGVPLPFYPGGVQNAFDWIDVGDGMAGAQQSSLMRGHPGALAGWQRKQIRGRGTIAQGRPVYLQAPTWDRGAAAFAPKFGTLNINPIGSGVDAPYKLPVSGGPAARYEFGAIWFDVQTIPTSVQMSPTMPIQSVSDL